ncbi:V-type ATP synthase subunit K [Candidatus Woesearchaeota archaeon]|nr:MAG: V-type ATP synthase subunit K [Candidatus Woesearchaeota archaeon]
MLLVGAGIIGVVKSGLGVAAGLVAVGAGLAVGLAAVSAVGQGVSAASGITAVAEKKEMFGKSIIFSIIPETQALMGFLIAILIMIGTGLMGASDKLAGLGIPTGLVAVGAALAIGIAAVSAVGQGYVVSAGIASVLRDVKMFGKALLFSVLPQTQALYGFLISVLLLVGGGIIGASRPDLSLPLGLVSIGAGLAVGFAAISAMGQGIAAASAVASVTEDNKRFGKSILFSVLPETQALYGFLVAILLLVGGGIIGATKASLSVPAGLIAVGAGLAVGLGAVSAIGQGIAASSGVGATAENDKVFGKSILFSVLPETQALYGIIIAILLMTGAGLLGALKSGITIMQGLGGIGAGIAIGFSAVSAVGQGVVSAMSIGASVRNPKSTGKGLVLSVMPETYAIFGLLISILIMIGLHIL